jgi:hypothetical protein
MRLAAAKTKLRYTGYDGLHDVCMTADSSLNPIYVVVLSFDGAVFAVNTSYLAYTMFRPNMA